MFIFYRTNNNVVLIFWNELFVTLFQAGTAVRTVPALTILFREEILSLNSSACRREISRI